MTLSEKSAYLKGLMDGLKLNTESDEGKMISAIVDLLGDLTRKVTDIEETTIAISDELDEIEEDLDAIEDYILDEEDEDWDEDYEDEDDEWDEDEEDDEDWEECDGDCTSCDGCNCEDEEYYEIVCPSCGETVCFDGELDPENLICPACGEKFGCIVEEDDYKKLTEEE